MAHRTSTASTRGANAYLAWLPAPPPVLGTDGTSASVAMSAITPSATTAVYELRQPSAWPTRVPSGTPSAADTATPEITAEIARPMRSGGTIEMPTTNP